MKNWLSIKFAAVLFIMISFVCTFGLPVMAQEQPDYSDGRIIYKSAKLANITTTATTTTSTTAGLTITQFDFGNFPSVDVYAKVTDSNGDFVNGLDDSNFDVQENFSLISPISVTTTQSGTSASNIGIVIDKSGSMSSTDMDNAKTAVKDFIDLTTGSQDQIGLVSFDSDVNVMKDFTTDRSALKNEVDTLNDGGTTAFYDAVAKAIDLAVQQAGAKYVIAFTDGRDNASDDDEPSFDNPPANPINDEFDLIDYANAQGVPIYTIGIGGVDQSVLEDIAQGTGGEYTAAYSSADLQAIYSQLKGRIGQQYKLSFASNQTSSGSNTCYDISVYFAGNQYSVNQCETIPSPPTIDLTQDTSDMTQQGGAPQFGNSVNIAANVTDPDGDNIQDVSLFYRTLNSSNTFSKLTMNNPTSTVSTTTTTDPTLYSAEIPAADYVDPGVEFYITASDGSATRTKPARDYYTIGDGGSSSVEQIYQVEPGINESLSFGATGGQLGFTFTKVTGADKYVLYLQLTDILNNYDIPIEVDLVPQVNSSYPWGGSGNATPGFTETFLGMNFVTSLGTSAWDAFSKYEITWGVKALDANGQVIGSTFKNNQEVKYARNLKLISSESIVLTAPSDGSVLDQSIDGPPTFKWETYQGVSNYNLYLVHQGSVGFDKMINESGLTLNQFSMNTNAWQTMDTGKWYWTVMGSDGANQKPKDFTIFGFEVQQ